MAIPLASYCACPEAVLLGEDPDATRVDTQTERTGCVKPGNVMTIALYRNVDDMICPFHDEYLNDLQQGLCSCAGQTFNANIVPWGMRMIPIRTLGLQ